MRTSNIFRLLATASVIALTGSVTTVSQAIAQGAVEQVRQGSGQRIQLGLNKSKVIDLPRDAYDILVSNPVIADAVTRTSRRIYLFGKAVGSTNVYVFGSNGEQIANFEITIERDVAGVTDYLKRFLPTSNINVELINDNVVLTGTVETPLDAKRAAELAELFVKGGEATTGQYNQSPSASGGSIIIGDQDEARRTSAIVNLLQIIGEDQVTLKVTVAEISRNVMKQLGVRMLADGGSNGISWDTVSNPIYGLGKPLASSGVGFSTSLLDGYLNSMEQAGVMKTLAEPTLTAVSGEQATFKVGGEFNLITEQSVSPGSPARDTNGDGVIDEPATFSGASYSVQKLEYGISLDFRPVVLSAGRISLKVRTSVSEPTTEGSAGFTGEPLRLLGTNAVSIRKRLADTTVELPSGGSMMIAGLVRDDIRQAVNGLPGLSKIPVLGTLFRSRDFVRNETELVILVTPYLSRPVARNELAKPDDNFNAASDGAGMFLGRVNRVYGTMKTNRPNGRYHGVVGYIYK